MMGVAFFVTIGNLYVMIRDRAVRWRKFLAARLT
nr:DUF5368 family protein [Tropicibacter oceani]